MVPQNFPAGKSVVTTPKQSESEIGAFFFLRTDQPK